VFSHGVTWWEQMGDGPWCTLLGTCIIMCPYLLKNNLHLLQQNQMTQRSMKLLS